MKLPRRNFLQRHRVPHGWRTFQDDGWRRNGSRALEVLAKRLELLRELPEAPPRRWQQGGNHDDSHRLHRPRRPGQARSCRKPCPAGQQ